MNESKRLNLLCLRRVATPRFCFAGAMIRLSEWRPKMCFEYPEREYHRVFKRKGTARKSRMEANSNRRSVLVVYLSRFAFSLCPRRVFVKNASCFRRVSLTLFQNKGYHEFPSKKNAPFRGKFQVHLIMRDIGFRGGDRVSSG